MESLLRLFRRSSKDRKTTLKNEEKRLEELYAYEILDSLPEQDFEELVELAVHVSGCPIASISFIDRDRQWFKASKGIPVPQTPRDVSFCTHTIQEQDNLVVKDARKDKRFAKNPFVTGGMKVVFYAGTPIISENGYNLGTVCVIDQRERSLSPAQMACLKIIAKQVTHILDLRLRTRILQERSEKLLAESEKSYQAFFENDHLPKWIYELETLRILQVNAAAERVYGYSREEFLSMSVFDFRDEKEPAHIAKLVKTLNEGNSAVSFETFHKTGGGKTIPVQVMISNITYGSKPARLATMNDLSGQRNQRDGKGLETEVTKAANAAREEERAYIGKELHDNINQVLASTKLYLEVAANNSEMKDEMIRLGRENISQAIKEIRQLSKSLVTPSDEFNLLRSLDDLVNSYLVTGAFTIDLSGPGEIEDLPADLKITVFRVIQEALNNIAKHSGATAVSIELDMKDRLTVCVTDNGKGFNTEENTAGIGLLNIRKRVAFYQGKIDIDSRRGKGCRFFVELPVSIAGPD